MSEPSHADIMRAVGVLEGKMDAVAQQVNRIEAQSQQNAVSTAKLWVLSIFGGATSGGVVSYLPKWLGGGSG